MSDGRYVYILRLAALRWYVGVCDGDPEAAYLTHFNGLGGEWTAVHKPQSMELVAIFSDDETVTRLTLSMMKRYGIDLVRGYPWTEMGLSIDLRASIQSVCMSGPTLCWICGVAGHLPSLCQTPRCARCHRYGHGAEYCGASRDRFSFPIDVNIVCRMCSHHSHTGNLVCSWYESWVRDVTDDLLSSQIVGVNAYRMINGTIEYCIETSGGNMWLRYSMLREINCELVSRGIDVDGFPAYTWCGWIFRRSKSTSDWRLSCLDRYFRQIPTRRIV